MEHVFTRYPGFRDKALTLSYDDGDKYDKRLIEIMSKHGLRGTFNISSSFMGSGGYKLTREEVEALYLPSGNEIGVHGVAHLSLAAVDVAVATSDIINDRLALEEMCGCLITGMAYANGSADKNSANILKCCGIKYARTVESTESFGLPEDWLYLKPTCHHNNPRLMELAREFAEAPPAKYSWRRTPKLFYLWGHGFEFEFDDKWNIIEEFAEYIGNRDDIWYATNGEIYDYIKAAESLRFGVNMKMVENPSSKDIYLDIRGKKVIAAAGKTTVIE